MIEIFKTDVEYPSEAEMLLSELHKHISNHQASFDLEDCDRILRVKCTRGILQSDEVIGILGNFGYKAAVLTDEVLPFTPIVTLA
jgi:hypothetical protein